MSATELERAFEPFYTTKGHGDGTGLGLTLTRAIIRDHGGSIRLESAPARGTRAIVRLPLAPVTPEVTVLAQTRTSSAPTSD